MIEMWTIEKIVDELTYDIEVKKEYIYNIESTLDDDLDSPEILFRLAELMEFGYKYQGAYDYLIERAAQLKHPDAMLCHVQGLLQKAQSRADFDLMEAIVKEALDLGGVDEMSLRKSIKKKADELL